MCILSSKEYQAKRHGTISKKKSNMTKWNSQPHNYSLEDRKRYYHYIIIYVVYNVINFLQNFCNGIKTGIFSFFSSRGIFCLNPLIHSARLIWLLKNMLLLYYVFVEFLLVVFSWCFWYMVELCGFSVGVGQPIWRTYPLILQVMEPVVLL